MLELKDVSLFVDGAEGTQALLSDIQASFPKGHFTAIIGPSGCGKSTLLKTIAGIADGEEEGNVLWNGRNLEDADFEPHEIGYVPQFSIAHEELTVEESVSYAMQLRLKQLKGKSLREAVFQTLDEVGLKDFSDRRVRVLSGGQRRRLSLAMEIASKPSVLLCDEVTSGLDPQSEDEIVLLLRDLSRHQDRLVLSVTHSLQHLDLYDSVVVLYEGELAYHGPPEALAHYFRVEDASQLYKQLEIRKAVEWRKSWKKHRHHFELNLNEISEAATLEIDFESREEAPETTKKDPVEETKESDQVATEAPESFTPGAMSQWLTLLGRRIKIFFRNPAQLWLQLGLIFGFPFLVAVFAWNGLPNVRNLSMGLDQDFVQQAVEAKEFVVQATSVGSLVSGIVMFQVILLTLMGANNSGREIASERLIFEKEKLAGLRPGSYVASKATFILLLVTLQSVWMGLFVHFICDFPGPILAQLVFLWLANAAMSMICLALSSWLATAEQSSLASIYLVGFQLPLSGAVLALPEWIGLLTRPFIAAYWSWSGILQTLRGERYYDIVQMVSQTVLSPAALSLWVLTFHVIIGIFLTWLGCKRQTMA
jgi:ABC-type multidrug transport system ATPase subunit